jgi:hypothetical protein
MVSCNRADCRWGSEILSAVPAMMVTGIERSIYLGALAAADGTMSADSSDEARIWPGRSDRAVGNSAEKRAASHQDNSRTVVLSRCLAAYHAVAITVLRSWPPSA